MLTPDELEQLQPQQQPPQPEPGLATGAHESPAPAAAAAAASEPAAAHPTPEAAILDPTPEEIGAAADSGCWAMLRGAWRALLDLLSPKHDYAMAQPDLLGDPTRQAGFAEEDESWRTQRKKLSVVELGPAAKKRVLRDLRRLKSDDGALGLWVDDCECLTDWVVKLVGAAGTVYEGEIYRLRVRFGADYPARPPEIRFMRPAPVHEHIYSDGKICLNILYSDWDPKMDVRSTCLSLLSMLSSAKKKSRPPDNNATVVMTQGQSTGSMQWEFHDDHC